MLEQEALSLSRLRETATVRVPAVLGTAPGWIALEWLEPEAPTRNGWRDLGAGLARLHRSSAPRYGWESANYIGSLPQSNEWTDRWAAFWRDERLSPQVEQAAARIGSRGMRAFDRLLAELDTRLDGAGDDGPSLLHGDLWSGNVHFTRSGGAVIDPSTYYGHREVDLAMAALFGGFPPEFESGYSAEWPLADGARERRPIYQLYYLLVHVNLFGDGYVDQTMRVLESVR